MIIKLRITTKTRYNNNNMVLDVIILYRGNRINCYTMSYVFYTEFNAASCPYKRTYDRVKRSLLIIINLFYNIILSLIFAHFRLSFIEYIIFIGKLGIFFLIPSN